MMTICIYIAEDLHGPQTAGAQHQTAFKASKVIPCTYANKLDFERFVFTSTRIKRLLHKKILATTWCRYTMENIMEED